MELDMHRAKKNPDWTTVPVTERNVWQRVGAATNGFVTPANAVTLIGGLLSLWGVGELIAGQAWWAIGFLAIGRVLDIFDGMVAQATGTKSHVGEILDATVDKIVLAVTVAGMFIAHVAATWVLGLFLLPHVIIVVIVIIDRVRGVELHPSRLGKTTALLAWIAVPLLLLEFALRNSVPDLVGSLVTVFVVVTAAFGFITANSYLHPHD